MAAQPVPRGEQLHAEVDESVMLAGPSLCGYSSLAFSVRTQGEVLPPCMQSRFARLLTRVQAVRYPKAATDCCWLEE